MGEKYDHSDLTLHGRFTEDGQQYRLYVLLNGHELPVQYLSVPDYRETFEAAKQPAEDDDSGKKKTN